MSSTEGFGQKIEDELETTWSDVVAFIGKAETWLQGFFAKLAQGGEILIEDIDNIASYINANVATLNTTVSAIASTATVVAGGNATVQKLVADLQTGVNDAAAVASSISSGQAANSSTLVTDAMNGVAAVKSLTALAATVGSQLASLSSSTPGAATAISPPTPNPG